MLMLAPSPIPFAMQGDLRIPFPHEERDFTPWVAGNLPKLGRALGMRLRFIDRELTLYTSYKKIDILAEEQDLDTAVVIENQLDESDDNHLGKLLVYSSAVKAGVAVWIASSFSNNHRAAIDWINANSSTSFQMYGVEALVRKGRETKRSTRFHIASHPSHWNNTRRSPVPDEPPNVDELYRMFWQSLIDELHEVGFPGNPKASTRRYCEFATGAIDFKYVASFAPIRGTASVSLAAKGSSARYRLHEISDSLNLELDNYLWKTGTQRRARIDDSAKKLSGTRSWMVKTLLRLQRKVHPLLEQTTWH